VSDASLRERVLELRSLARRWETDLRDPDTTQEQIEQIARELPGVKAELRAIEHALDA
jgi:sensor domain CHASE-containing protein